MKTPIEAKNPTVPSGRVTSFCNPASFQRWGLSPNIYNKIQDKRCRIWPVNSRNVNRIIYIFVSLLYVYTCFGKSPYLFLATDPIYFPRCARGVAAYPRVDFIHSVYLFFSRPSARQLFYHRADVNERGPNTKRVAYLRIMLNDVQEHRGRTFICYGTKYFSTICE